MDDKKSAKAERTTQAPTHAKRALRSASAAVTETVASKQKKQNGKSILAAPRALLEKEGFLKQDELIMVDTLFDAFKLMHDRFKTKLSPKTNNAMIAFKMMLGVLAVDQRNEDTGMKECADIISAKVEKVIDRGLAKLSTALESSSANQKDMQSTSKRIEESAAAIQKAVEEVDKNLAVMSDSSNKLTNTMSSYKDALMKAPIPQQQDQAGRKVDANDPRIVRDQNRKACQVLIDIFNKDMVNHSLKELKSSFNNLIGIEPTEPLCDANVQHITKLRNGGLILQFETKEAAEWFKQTKILSSILPKIDSSATLKNRTFQILVPRVPVTFETEKEDSLRKLEEQNSMKDGILRKARWIKPTYRRALGQRYAHLALSVSSLGEANIIIRDGIYICGTKVYPRKLKIEPKQCMKCRKWGHFAAECLEEKDVCGNCGEDHQTKDCLDKNRRYCVSCKDTAHASWDRGCPEFKWRVEKMDENHLENVLMYFPTDEDWTTQACPAGLDLDTRFPAKYKVASLPLPTKDARQPPTHQVANKKKGPKLVQYQHMGPMDNYISASSSSAQKQSELKLEEEFYESLSQEEIAQLETAFTQE